MRPNLATTSRPPIPEARGLAGDTATRRVLSAAAPVHAPVGLEACWVADGRLLAGAHPGAGPYALRDRLDVLLEAGVRHFIDLTMPEELADYESELIRQAEAREATVSYSRLPLPRRSQPRDRRRVGEVVERLEQCLAEPGVTYLHGRDPMRRPGLIVGCLLVQRGQSSDVALNWLETRHWRNGGRLETRPLTREQRALVRVWRKGP